MDVVSVGIVGLGRSGWNIHAAALAEHNRFRVVAVADPLDERRGEAEARFGCRTYDDPSGVLDDSDVAVAVIATPPHTHCSLTIAALQAGKHVVVEKPMALSFDDTDAMADAAKRADRVLTCYQPRRLDADFRMIRSLVDSGRIGDLVLARRVVHRFARRADWGTLRKFGGGELPNNASHLVDQLLLLLGGDCAVAFSSLRRTVSAGDAEDHVKLCLRSSSGAVGEVEATFCAALPQPSWLIMGTRGGIVGSQRELRVRWFEPEGLPPLQVNEGAAEGRRYASGAELPWQEETQHPEQERSPALMYYDALADTLQNGAPLLVTPDSVQRQIALLDHARESACTGH